MIVSKHLRLNTVCPWLPLVAPSTLIICTLTFEKVTSLTHIMGKTAHVWVQLHTASVLDQLLAPKVEILLVGFCPKIFGGNGDLNSLSSFCSKMHTVWVMVIIWGGGNTQTLHLGIFKKWICNVVGLILQWIEPEFDWSRDIKGIILSAFSYGYISTQFIAGVVAKKLGPKKVIVFGYSLVILATLLSPKGAKWSPYALAALQVVKGMCGVCLCIEL